jgi:hypothetical protein
VSRSRLAAVGPFLLEPMFNHIEKMSEVDGFCDEVVTSGVQTLLSCAFHAVCGQGNDRRFQPFGAQLSRGNVAVYFWHLHVHQNQFIGIAFCLSPKSTLTRLQSIFDGVDFQFCPSREEEHQTAIVWTVVGKKNTPMQFAGWQSGRGDGGLRFRFLILLRMVRPSGVLQWTDVDGQRETTASADGAGGVNVDDLIVLDDRAVAQFVSL